MTEVVPYSTQVYHLRRAGRSFEQIAEEMGIEVSKAVEHFRSYMISLVSASTMEEREYLKAMELDRLDQMMLPFYNAAVEGDKEGAEVTLKIMAHRAKLGQLDRADPNDDSLRTQVIVVSGDRHEFEEALRLGRERSTVAGSLVDDDQEKEAR
jgi:hypothetical protein